MENISKVLVLAAHPDDGEFGAGGTIKKLTDSGIKVYYAAFSPCTVSVPDGFEKDILFKELMEATGILGIDPNHVNKYNYPVRRFSENRQNILEDLIKLRNELNPDLVLLPNSHDIHQDHRTIYEEGIRAFKHIKIIGYELPWNNYDVTNNFHIELKEEHIEAKMRAIGAYKSQGKRKYSSKDFFYGLSTVRGLQVNKKYAESFELIRWII